MNAKELAVKMTEAMANGMSLEEALAKYNVAEKKASGARNSAPKAPEVPLMTMEEISKSRNLQELRINKTQLNRKLEANNDVYLRAELETTDDRIKHLIKIYRGSDRKLALGLEFKETGAVLLDQFVDGLTDRVYALLDIVMARENISTPQLASYMHVAPVTAPSVILSLLIDQSAQELWPLYRGRAEIGHKATGELNQQLNLILKYMKEEDVLDYLS
jgi:hypothetical protein